jgi:starch phosphorylase
MQAAADRKIEYQAEMLAAKVKHYLITILGKTSDEANNDEMYQALSYALREETMINWLATTRTRVSQDTRMLYYLSMEYLPGKLLTNNVSNLCLNDIVEKALGKLNRSYGEIAAREAEPGLGNGGLGRLASCFLDSLATLHYPAMAYGLRYQYGSFEQQLWDGVQVEAPDCWLLNENPWIFRRDQRKVRVKFCGSLTPSKTIHGDDIYFLNNNEEVWALPYDVPIIGYSPSSDFSVVTLRLWSTKESPRNFQLQRYNAGQIDQAAENTTLTDVLYPSDYHEMGKRIRLKQEFLLVSASLSDIIRRYLETHDNFRAFSDKIRIQINDTHPTLVIPELIRLLTQKYDLPWKTAVDITLECTSYTNHTVLAEALEQWDKGLMQYLLPRQLKVIERLNEEFCNRIRSSYPADEAKVQRMSIFGDHDNVRMANLALMGHHVNGVAALHTNILRTLVFKDFAELFPNKFVNITNGVTQRHWLLHCNPDLANFITARIGAGWITNFAEIIKLAPFGDDPDSQMEFLQIKKRNKERLAHFISQNNKLRDSYGQFTGTTHLVTPDALFDVQIKRIHEYKRQLLNALHVIMLYQELLENPNARLKRVVFFAGKAAASYKTAKDIIRLIWCLARRINNDPKISGQLKVIFVENYNVSKAEVIVPAAEVSEQISTAGTEASGTGNMKLAINGALTVGTNDGANVEMRQNITDEFWPFSFGAEAKEIEELKISGSYDPRKIYEEDPKILAALNSLNDGTFANTQEECLVLNGLFNILTNSNSQKDNYFNLLDLRSFYDVQLKVEELYRKPRTWARMAINNLARMGYFSSDRSIDEYNKLWQLPHCPLGIDILEDVRNEYAAADRCRIY